MNYTDRSNKLTKEHQTYFKIFDNFPDAIFIHDYDGVILNVNSTATKLLGYSKDELLEKNIIEIDVSITNSSLLSDRLDQLKSDNAKTFQNKLKQKNKSSIPVEFTISILEFEKQTLYLVNARDISQTIKKEKELAETKTKAKEIGDRLQILSDNLPEGYVYQLLYNLKTGERKFTFVSETVKKIHNLTPTEIYKDSSLLYNLVHEDDIKLLAEQEKEAVENLSKFICIIRFNGKNGNVSYRLLNAHPQKISENEIIWNGVSIDITKEKQAENTLIENKARFQAFMKFAPFYAYIKNSDLVNVYNNSDNKFHPLISDDIKTDLNMRDIFDKISIEKLEDADKKIITGESDFEEITFKYNINGKEYWLRDIKFPIIFSEDKRYVAGITEDLTPNKQKEALIHERDIRFRKFFELGLVGMAITSLEKNWVEFNDVLCNIFGYTRDEFIKLTWAELTHPDDLEEDVGYFNQVLNGKIDGYKMQKRFIHKDGSIIHAEISVNAIRKPDNSVDYFVAIVHDITQRVRYENELILEKEKAEDNQKRITKQNKKINLNSTRLESLLKIAQFKTNSKQELLDFALHEAVILTDSKIGYVYFYDETKEQFLLNTWSKDNLNGYDKHFTKTSYSLNDAGCWAEAIRKRKPIIINDFNEDNPMSKGIPEGHVTLSNFLIIPVFVDNNIVAVCGVANKTSEYDKEDINQLTLLMDNVWKITERIELIKSLQTAKDKAEESDRLKTEFLNNMSHEIRTPMNGIIGFCEMINKPKLNDEKRKYFTKIIKNSSQQLLKIIDDILEISTLEAKQEKVLEEKLCLNYLLMELFSIFSLKSKERNLPIYLKKSLRDNQSHIITDRTKLNKILSNLIENALKYTNEGYIEIGYHIEDSLLKIYVKDTGIGISPENHKLIFERFSQEDKELTRKHGGLGLGLSISKENAEILGGSISLDSKKGEGSTFTVNIPYKPVNSNFENILNSNDINTKPSGNPIILIVEDEEINYLFIETLLEDESDINFTIIHAKNGQEAVNLCNERKNIDLVLMDIKMPVMNGHEATGLIKSKFPNLPIIAQTAYSTEADKKLALEYHCDDFITKPLDKEKLFELIHKYVNI